MSKILIGAGLIAAALMCAAPALAQTPAAAPAAAAAPAGTATLVLTLRNLKSGKGAVMVALYSNGPDWAANTVPFQRTPVSGRFVDVTFTGLTPGLYAAKIFYDVNDDGKQEPGEPVTYTGDWKDRSSGAPVFNDASVPVHAGMNRQSVNMPDITNNSQ